MAPCRAGVNLDQFDGDGAGMGGKRGDIGLVARQYDAAWFSERDHERIHGRASLSLPPKFGGSSGDVDADNIVGDDRLQESVGIRVATGAPLERFDEHHRGHDWRPKSGGSQFLYQRQRCP
jgi:hypothetical protein